jgi:hypothetical protein
MQRGTNNRQQPSRQSQTQRIRNHMPLFHTTSQSPTCAGPRRHPKRSCRPRTPAGLGRSPSRRCCYGARLLQAFRLSVSVLARTDPPRPRSISTLLTQIWLLERARLQSWHRCSGVQNTEPYRCLMLHVPPLLCTYRFFWVTMIKPLISSLASVLIKARQQSQWILVLLDNAAVHSPHAVLQVCHLNFCPSACPDHFLSRCMHACGCGISLGFCRRCSEDQRVISERSGLQQVG